MIESLQQYGWLPFVVVMVGMTYLLFGNFFLKVSGSGKRLPTIRFRPIDLKYKEPLAEHFLYYQNLSEENKKRFETRVQAFIDGNEFIARGYTHITDEMKALIAASAIQLTFGFNHLNFEHFAKILIYPDDYYSRITRKYHAGEVNMRGIVVLSWRNFVEGYKDHTDGKNLGLHEMAHALRLENGIENGEYDFIDADVLNRFHELGVAETRLIKRGQTHFFRHYAAMNMHEFFSVAVENFFERPQEFMDYHPELYMCLSELLKQDPLKLMPVQSPDVVGA